jgi:serine---pyruvate transaminase
MLFTPGPTEVEQGLRDIGSMSLPYFRGKEYTDTIQELTQDLKYLFQTTCTPLTLTSSGTGAMEMAIQNLIDVGDPVVVVNCGTFGTKWVNMCKTFGARVTEVKSPLGKLPDINVISDAITNGTKAVLVTAHETSTGLLNDINAMGELARQKDTLLIVDAVSSIGADHFNFDEFNCDCAIVSSQKALACMPGLSFIVFSEKAWKIIPTVKRGRCYFDAVEYMNNIGRGMLPYTPAMQATFQVHARLKLIRKMGLSQYIEAHAKRASSFRSRMTASDEFSLFAERQSNSLTSLTLPDNCMMSEVTAYIGQKYNWYIAPNPTQDESYLRISHMGNMTDYELSILADRIEEACQYVSR